MLVLAGSVLAMLLFCPVQAAAKTYRVAFLTSVGAGGALGDAIIRALSLRGYTPEKDLLIESRSAAGDMKRLPGLVRDLVKIPVDLIVTFSYPAAQTAKAGAGTIPIVAVGSGDPVGADWCRAWQGQAAI